MLKEKKPEGNENSATNLSFFPAAPVDLTGHQRDNPLKSCKNFQ